MAWYTVWHCGHGTVYGKAWRSSHLVYGMALGHAIWYGLAGIPWYMVWPGGHSMVSGIAWHAHHMVYTSNVAWWASHGVMVWPGGPGMGYGMTLGASHGIVWPGWHSMAWWALHSSWYGLVGIAQYIVVAWQARHGAWHSI